MASTRHVFSFVVEGVELSDDQKSIISKAVGQAGAMALSESGVAAERYFLGPYLPGYRGLPAYDLAAFATERVGALVDSTNELAGRLAQSVDAP